MINSFIGFLLSVVGRIPFKIQRFDRNLNYFWSVYCPVTKLKDLKLGNDIPIDTKRLKKSPKIRSKGILLIVLSKNVKFSWLIVDYLLFIVNDINVEGKVFWFELMDAKDAFEVMHVEWRWIVDKLTEMKLDGRLSNELFTEIIKDEHEFHIQRFPRL